MHFLKFKCSLGFIYLIKKKIRSDMDALEQKQNVSSTLSLLVTRINPDVHAKTGAISVNILF